MSATGGTNALNFIEGHMESRGMMCGLMDFESGDRVESEDVDSKKYVAYEGVIERMEKDQSRT